MPRLKLKKKNKKIVVKKKDVECPYEYEGQILCKQTTIYAIKFNPFDEENDIFACAIDNIIKIYKVKNKDESKTMLEIGSFQLSEDECIYSMDWSLSGSDEFVLIAGGKNGILYDVLNQDEFIDRNFEAINEVKFNPGNRTLFAIASAGGFGYLLNAETKICVAAFEPILPPGPIKEVITVSFHPEGKYLAVAGMDKRISIFNISSNPELQVHIMNSVLGENIPDDELPLFGLVCDTTFSNLHSNYIDSIIWYFDDYFFSKSCDGDVIIWFIVKLNGVILKFIKLQTILVPDCNFWFMKMEIHPSGYLVIGNSAGNGYLCDIKTLPKIQSTHLVHPYNTIVMRAFSFSKDGSMIICSSDDGKITRFDKIIIKKETEDKTYRLKEQKTDELKEQKTDELKEQKTDQSQEEKTDQLKEGSQES